ncbi:MAG: flavodoxin domain-containing protein [Chitinophagaceae bacterium]
MKGIIVYKGKYGATQQYARWLGEELNIPVADADAVDRDTLSNVDFIVIGTSVYIGKLQIRKWLKANLAAVKPKKIFFFQVAATPPDQREKLETYIRSGVPEEIRNQCDFYFYPGKMIFQQLSWQDRFMLKMGAKLTKDPEAKKGMLTDFDLVKRENITGLVNAVRKISTASKEKVQPV